MVLGGEIINVLRWMVGEQPVRRSHPPRDVQPYEPFLGYAPAGHQPVRAAGLRHSPRRTCAGPNRRDGAPRRRSRSRRRRSWRRGSGSCTATTAASTRSPTSAGSARTTRPSSASPTTSSRRSSPRSHPTRRCSSPPTTVRSTSVTTSCTRRPSCWRGVLPVRGGPIQVAARVTGSDLVDRRDRRPGGRPPRLRRHQGSDARRALVRPSMAPAIRARLGDVALVAHEPVSFYDPADSGPFELVCRHGALTSAEVNVPLLATVV